MFLKHHQTKFSILLLLVSLAFLLNLSLGQVAIPFLEVVHFIFGKKLPQETWHYILLDFRLPKAITALLVGSGLSICGLLMQTFFRNPMAGPYVLGLSSGSSLGVAILLLGSEIFSLHYISSQIGIATASFMGSLFVLLLIVLVSRKLKDTMSILIVGLMFSSFTSAFVSVLTYFSTAEQLQRFTFWSMGNLANMSWEQVLQLTLWVCSGTFLAFLVNKPLDALLLGENYAKSMGVNMSKTRWIIIFSSSILAGSITALVGPIAFVGLAVPHIAKLMFHTSNHKVLFFATFLLGSLSMLICDTISQLPGQSFMIPINAITSLFGAPIVIYLLIHKNRIW